MSPDLNIGMANTCLHPEKGQSIHSTALVEYELTTYWLKKTNNKQIKQLYTKHITVN